MIPSGIAFGCLTNSRCWAPLLLGCLLPAAAVAAPKTPPAGKSQPARSDSNSGQQQTEEAEPAEVPEVVELGQFVLTELRPTRNETAKLRFTLHLQLRAGASSATAEALQHWKHRLRDQTITAVRTAEMIDFADPQLARLQKIIRLRINRALPTPLVDKLLLTGFTMSDL